MDETKDLSIQKQILEPLEKQLGSIEIDNQIFQNTYQDLINTKLYFKELVEYALRKEPQNKNLSQLHTKLTRDTATDLVDNLRNLGFSLRNKSKNIREAFEKAGYRLLEQTRANKRDDVYFGILRIFISTNETFPKLLTEPFKPHYTEEIFKIFIFSFLSGLLQKENE